MSGEVPTQWKQRDTYLPRASQCLNLGNLTPVPTVEVGRLMSMTDDEAWLPLRVRPALLHNLPVAEAEGPLTTSLERCPGSPAETPFLFHQCPHRLHLTSIPYNGYQIASRLQQYHHVNEV